MEPLRRELYISRLYDAPRNQVFRAWTEVEHMCKWWGPKDFTNHSCEIETGVGGRLSITMRGPDGQDYPMRGVFTEFKAPERLAFDFEALDLDGKAVLTGRLTLALTDEGGKTRLSLSTWAEGDSEDAAAKLGGMEQGWNQSLERLAASLKV
ncbi:MAG TPA: SRPBCC domain-containing protein [Gammaproteobacteria bacterium]|jgi:uncharacterized protein YndB with AHSA1/START domain|nr:SRPBCC domain-containing protein [Gammaproteobacteria bacterium]